VFFFFWLHNLDTHLLKYTSKEPFKLGGY